MPVISINLSGLESNPGFKLTLPLIKRVCYGAVFGDILMKCVYRMRPYELEPGIVNRKHKIWEQRVISFLEGSRTEIEEDWTLCKLFQWTLRW